MVRAQLASGASAEREWARPWPHAGTRLRPGRPAGLVHHGGLIPTSYEAFIFSYNSDDGGNYSASEERTFSRTCKSRVLCRYREYLGPR